MHEDLEKFEGDIDEFEGLEIKEVGDNSDVGWIWVTVQLRDIDASDYSGTAANVAKRYDFVFNWIDFEEKSVCFNKKVDHEICYWLNELEGVVEASSGPDATRVKFRQVATEETTARIINLSRKYNFTITHYTDVKNNEDLKIMRMKHDPDNELTTWKERLD